jgi:hypothetical protein
VAPYDEEEIAQLASIGVHDLEDDPTVLVEGPGPRLFLQRVPEGKQVKNRVHLDLLAAELDGDVAARLTELGASVAARYDGHLTLTDPEGNEFCLMQV